MRRALVPVEAADARVIERKLEAHSDSYAAALPSYDSVA